MVVAISPMEGEEQKQWLNVTDWTTTSKVSG